MQLLEGKTALITGATRGIGKGIAQKFSQQGANIAFTYRSSVEKAQALAQELEEHGVKAKGYQSDAADHQAAEELIKRITQDFEGLEVVVNNAGITQDNLLLRLNEEQWDEVINTNLKSIFNISKFAVKPMMKNRKGSFIHVSSIVGLQGNPGQSNYAASKAGIVGFSKSLAKELGSRNIRSNVVAPGFIETEMTEDLDEATLKKWQEIIPLQRPGQSEDVANTAVFLASDMSAYITGQTLSVCGGMEM
ncbi:MAG: 3-oxoacyl-[acyl-carrier-protein] reductase [Bacteroidetes bacterium SW_10_40_5]|nr:MAG: 3-oxoacyl-[acyl-carrier-protein] reductase [Bacteroidetes bacterium SW_10_40_5]